MIEPEESLLSVLRERLGLTSVKDGCAPQGQCGCCTVLVDGEARVACVTPAARVSGRNVTTVEGLDAEQRDALASSFCAHGASQCGFCTPGIVIRCAAARAKGNVAPAQLDRLLAAHLCRCTGWQTIYEAVASTSATTSAPRDLTSAGRRAWLEGGAPQAVGPRIALGGASFADDLAPPGALVAVPLPPGSRGTGVEAAGVEFAVAESMHAARVAAAKVQGRRTTLAIEPPIPLMERPVGGVRLATSWVEPAYLEPDASWCEPGGEPATPLANGGAFGGKSSSRAPVAARELADRFGRPVRVVFSREDVVRWGPKRPPISATAESDGDLVLIELMAPAPIEIARADHYGLDVEAQQHRVPVAGPSTAAMRAPWAETAVLVEGALQAMGFDRAGSVTGAAAGVLLDTCVSSLAGAYAGARVVIGAGDRIESIEVRVAAGDPLDAAVLRSYCIGATHMALGWVLTEGLSVDPDSGEVHDLTIRSFGIIRPKDMPPVAVTITDDPRAPLPAGDAVFAAVAAATWIKVGLPESWPALATPVARRLRR